MKIRKRVLAYGETLWDLLPSGAVLGGAPFNFAYRAHSLGERATIVSRLGRDELGRRAYDEVIALGMDARLMQWDDEHPTGTVEVSFDAEHNPDYHIIPDVAYDNIETNAPLLDAAPGAHCLSFGTLIQRTQTSRRTLQELLDASPRSVKLLDVNLRKDCYTFDTVRLSLAEADILKLNDDEARQLAEMFGIDEWKPPGFCRKAIEQWSLSHCLVTFGERGAFVASRDEGELYVPGYRVDLVDSCGSGDAFAAGFVHMYLGGKPLGECAALANVMGAIVATQEGATAPISKEDIARFIEAEHERIWETGLEKYAPV